ncbi:telomerase inhibitor [Diatrype stigma]|uniref:PinX1-related protein 1 n=1 Tax=Diatrype stigma TaxID=117547 RepID=A0AAN9UZH4_9PEZI
MDDPNNTKWSRNENNFGQKIMRAQGWEPGKFLGAQNSAHSHLHSAASSAPIKVVLKDDTMGLGAKQRQKQSTECTGLDGFKDLLGRLNGKSEEVIETEQRLRSDIKTSLYVERRYGVMRFVNGGLLVGDQMKELVSTDPATLRQESTGQSTSEATEEEGNQSKKVKKEKKTKKRKADEGESTDATDTTRDKKRKKRSKEGIEQNEPAEKTDSPDLAKKRKKSTKSKEKDQSDDDSKSKKVKKEKKSKRSKDKYSSSTEPDIERQETGTAEDIVSKEKADKKKRKMEKKEKKLEKLKTSKETSSTANPTPSTITPAESGSSTPTGTGTSTPVVANRHHVRARFIASKRSAIADMQALNQIFMVKPV